MKKTNKALIHRQTARCLPTWTPLH